MLFLLSPSKTLDFNGSATSPRSTPRMRGSAAELVSIMRSKTSEEIEDMMSVSTELARMNWNRYQNFNPERYTSRNSRQAIFAFRGQVYHGLQAENFNQEDLEFAQKHLRILSGLYGLLRPMDAIQPYRLEMGAQLHTPAGKSLYDYWGDDITDLLNKDLRGHSEKVVVNLASQEYFKAVQPERLKGSLLNISFKEWKNDTLKIIAVYAKTARGLMSRYAIRNKIEEPDDLKGFDLEGYSWSEEYSSDSEWVFVRVSG